MPDYLVVLESAWLVRDVKSLNDAISVAISEAGKRLNPTAKFVEIESGRLSCPHCGEDLHSALIVANTAIVGLLLQMRVFRADSPEHAARIATSVIGKAVADIPLKVQEVAEL